MESKNEPITMKQVAGRTGQFRIGNCLIIAYALPEGGLVLIDSGAEEYPPLFSFLKAEHFSVRAVIHTHLHEDHIANDLLLQRRYGTVLYGPEPEIRLARDPEEVRSVLGLMRHLHTDYLNRVRQLEITPFAPRKQDLSVGSAVFTLIPLPGHSTAHTGIITPDGVFCVGDAMLSDFSLVRAKAPYEFHLGQTLDSLEVIRGIRCPYYALAHRQIVPETDIDDLLNRNRERLLALSAETVSLLRDGMTEEDLVDAVAARREIHHDYRNLYFDIYIAIREELQYAIDNGQVRAEGTGMRRKLYHAK